MANPTKSIAGRAHGAPPPKAKPQTKEYRPQLTGLPGVHPDVARAIATVFDNLYTLRSQVQSMAVSADVSGGSTGGGSAAAAASGASTIASGGAGSGGSGSSGSGGSSGSVGNILGLNIKAATDPSTLTDGSTLVYNSKSGQFEFSTPSNNTSGGANDVTTQRSFGTQYQNTTPQSLVVSGYGLTGGSSTGGINCAVGPTSASITVWGNSVTATIDNGQAAFFCVVPPNNYYQVTASGAVNRGVGKWVETPIS